MLRFTVFTGLVNTSYDFWCDSVKRNPRKSYYKHALGHKNIHWCRGRSGKIGNGAKKAKILDFDARIHWGDTWDLKLDLTSFRIFFGPNNLEGAPNAQKLHTTSHDGPQWTQEQDREVIDCQIRGELSI